MRLYKRFHIQGPNVDIKEKKTFTYKKRIERVDRIKMIIFFVFYNYSLCITS